MWQRKEFYGRGRPWWLKNKAGPLPGAPESPLCLCPHIHTELGSSARRFLFLMTMETQRSELGTTLDLLLLLLIHMGMETAAPPCSTNTVPTHQNHLLPRFLLPTALPRVLILPSTEPQTGETGPVLSIPHGCEWQLPWNLCICHVPQESIPGLEIPSLAAQGCRQGEVPCTGENPEKNCLSGNLDLSLPAELSCCSFFPKENLTFLI